MKTKKGQTMIKCVVFDCFGTVFDMLGVIRDEIKAYAESEPEIKCEKERSYPAWNCFCHMHPTVWCPVHDGNEKPDFGSLSTHRQ